MLVRGDVTWSALTISNLNPCMDLESRKMGWMFDFGGVSSEGPKHKWHHHGLQCIFRSVSGISTMFTKSIVQDRIVLVDCEAVDSQSMSPRVVCQRQNCDSMRSASQLLKEALGLTVANPLALLPSHHRQRNMPAGNSSGNSAPHAQ